MTAPTVWGAHGAPVPVTSPTRRAMAVLSTPLTGTLANTEITFRLSNMLPSSTTRWRIRIRNYLLRTEAVVASGASFVGIYHGEQELDATGQPTAGFVAAPTQAVGAFTLAADGTEYVSSWITAANNQITGRKPWLWSFGYTGGGTQGSSQGQMWYRIGAGSSAFVGDQPSTSFTSTGAAPFDIRIEYETVTDKKIVLFVGDSLTFGTASAIIPQQHSFPSIYANRSGHPSMNAGVSGSTVTEWDDASTLWKYQRFNPAEIVPDEAWIFLGTNDISANLALATYKTNLLAVIAHLRTLGVPKIGMVTIPPRNLAHGVVAKAVAAGATTLTLRTGGLSAGSVQIGEGGLSDTVTMSASPVDNGDGTYTYTITATTRAHYVNEIAALSQETLRLGYNAFIRGVPGATAMAVSMDRALEARHDKAVIQPELCQTDGLHPTLSGLAQMAAAIPA